MAIPVDVALAQDAADGAVKVLMELQRSLVPLNLGPGGYSYDSKHMTREDRILMFMDDVRSGALDHLKVINAEFYQDYVDQYNRDVAASPMFAKQGA